MSIGKEDIRALELQNGLLLTQVRGHEKQRLHILLDNQLTQPCHIDNGHTAEAGKFEFRNDIVQH